MATQQYLIRLEEDFIKRLEEASDQYGGTAFNSGNKVAADILNLYLPLWIEMKKAEMKVYKEQLKSSKSPPDQPESSKK